MVKIDKRQFLDLYLGKKNIRAQVDAVHARPPEADVHTEDIAKGIISDVGCQGIVATVSRKKYDLNSNGNNPAIKEYENSIRDILEHIDILDVHDKLTKPYLHISIHGMKNNPNKDIEVGTRNSQTCSGEVQNWLIALLKTFPLFKRLVVNKELIGTTYLLTHRNRYGENFNTVQIELDRNLRNIHRSDLQRIFSEIISNFHHTFK